MERTCRILHGEKEQPRTEKSTELGDKIKVMSFGEGTKDCMF